MAAKPVRPTAPVRCLGMLVGLLLFGSAGVALAQYKVVAPDGSITYTDRAPAAGSNRTEPLRAGPAAGGSTAELPFALRQVVARYPVTLYTAPACAPCDAARQLLRQRGVPLTERSVPTPDDVGELRSIEQTTDLPILRLGAQRLVGYSADEWTAMLDAAGYPRQSMLPTSYRHPAAQPQLVASQMQWWWRAWPGLSISRSARLPSITVISSWLSSTRSAGIGRIWP
jgi:glutaredoxin